MKKTLIATAIAAVAFSGTALAQSSDVAESRVAESRADALAARMDSMPEVYGNIQLAILHENLEDGGSQIGHFDNGSTIGVKHSHQITPGLEGFFVAELEFDADNKAGNGGLDSFDEAYIGIRGDNFGQLWVGSDDSTYESAIDKIVNYYEIATQNIGGSYTTGEGDLVQYQTPSFGGLKLHGAVQFNGDSENAEKSYPYQLAVTYEMGSLVLAAAMDSNDGDTGYSSTGILGQTAEIDPITGEIEFDDIFASPTSNENTYGLRATYSAGDLSLTGQYQTRSEFFDTYGVLATYSLGANVFAASVEQISFDEVDEADGTVLTVQALHNLSSNMYVYVEGYYGTGDDNFAGTGSDGKQDIGVGATYYF